MTNQHLKASLTQYLNQNIAVTIKHEKYEQRTIIGILEKVNYSGGYGIISGQDFDLNDIVEIRVKYA